MFLSTAHLNVTVQNLSSGLQHVEIGLFTYIVFQEGGLKILANRLLVPCLPLICKVDLDTVAMSEMVQMKQKLKHNTTVYLYLSECITFICGMGIVFLIKLLAWLKLNS